MKLLNISKFDFEFKGGIEKEAREVSSQLSRYFEVDTLCFGKSSTVKNVSSHERNIIFRSKRFMGKIDFSLEYLFFFARGVKKYDLIWLHYPNVLPVLLLYILRPKVDYIIHWHNDIAVLPILYRLFRPFENWLVHNANHIITTSPKYHEFSNAIKGSSNKIKSIPIRIYDSEVEVNIRKDISTTINLISIGRYTPYKGYKELIDLVEKSPEMNLNLVTNSILPTDLLTSIDSIENIILHQNICDEDLLDLLKKSDIYVMSSISRNEGYGIVLLEALRFGLPICVNYINGTGSNYILRPGFNGEFFNIESIDDFKSALLKIVDPNNFEFYQKNARQDFEERFMLTDIVLPYSDFYVKYYLDS